MCGSIGAYAGYNYTSVIEKMNEQVNQLKEERGHSILSRRSISTDKE